jgi:hypothetical protein
LRETVLVLLLVLDLNRRCFDDEGEDDDEHEAD